MMLWWLGWGACVVDGVVGSCLAWAGEGVGQGVGSWVGSGLRGVVAGARRGLEGFGLVVGARPGSLVGAGWGVARWWGSAWRGGL